MEALAGYRITEQLHDSDSSTVYRAVREADDEAVVLKVLNPAYPPPERIAWFKHEFDIAHSIDQPRVVRALDLETHDYRWFLVMEDAAGVSLDRLLQRRRLSLPEVLRVAIGLVEALGQVHASDVIHRDVNPSNVICGAATLDVKLTDFGIASRFARQDATLGSPDTLQGTLAYIAPEQTGRMNRVVDYRADFYSLGVTLYEMLTGTVPFETDDSMELVHCHLARQPTPVRDRSPEVPAPVSDLVMRLMAKTAEDRYQSTFGIKADLEECLRQVEATSTVKPFVLGRHDVYERFQIPQKLYGRERELDTLLSAFARAAASAGTPSEMMLVTGDSGIGKSVLVHELYTPITERRGYFISGKFDQLQRTTPYSAIVSAFRSLVQQLLTETPEDLERWREALVAALGPGAGVVVDVIPEVELIIGPQPAVQPLGPTETENRFTRVFQAFVRVLAQPSHPVALFLDDLQWADAASLNLCRRIMQDESNLSLLVIGSYRDNEVGPGHLLTGTLEKLREDGARIHGIHLGPLALEHVTALIADTTGVDHASCLELARLVVDRTGGNPFFVSVFLNTAYEEGLIRFDRQTGHWQWNAADIAARGHTDNVVAMTVDRLRRLPGATQGLLQLAACLGSNFELELLALLHGGTPLDAFDVLLPAVQEGFVLTTSAAEVVGEGGPLLVRRYRFVHDRVQQAAYALIDEAERQPIHLTIGRAMRERAGGGVSSEELFRLVGHLNLARDLIADGAERLDLATLNLEAARKAKAATAYAAAREYLLAALGLLGDSGWTDHRDLMLAIHQDLIDAEYLSGHHDTAERLANEMLGRDLRDIEKAEVYFRLVENYTLQARYPEALEAVRAGLRLVGNDVDLDHPEAALAEVAAELKDAMRGRDVASLLDEPEITDPEALVAGKLFKIAVAPSFYAGPTVYGLFIFKAVSLLLRSGASPEACTLYSSYGQIVSSVQGDIKTGDAWGRLAVAQSERFNRRDNVSLSIFVYSGFVAPWTTHLPEVIESLERGYRLGVESGELRFSGYTLVYVLLDKYFLGRPLEDLTPELDEYLSFSQKTKSQLSIDCFTGDAIIFDNLKGRHQDKLVFGTEAMTEDAFIESATKNQSWMAMCYYHICKQQVLYLYREPRASLAASDAADAHIANIMGNFAEAIHNFYTALALVACLESASDDEREAFAARVDANQRQMRIWADSCPENFLHMYQLVEAERARVAGDVAAALSLYEQAVGLARKDQFAIHEALANELAGRLQMRQGLAQGARESLSAAHYGYRLWGARHKVGDLEREFGWLAEGRAAAPAGKTRSTTRGTQTSVSLDLASVLKASQAISGEIVLEKLLRRLMRLVIENAGARRGVLVIDAEGSLLVEATAALVTAGDREELEIEVRQGVPLDSYHRIPRSVVAYAARTAKSVILNDALGEGSFTRDPYIVEARPKSVLCAPLSGHGRTVGVLYLENSLVTGAFTPERLEVLQVLSAQFAISFENARLYEDMEHQVARRTEELSQKNQALEQALADLKSTQAQLVHSEKMASLGQLTAGVAHEINNPLNFVNNFAVLCRQLVDELVEAKDRDPELRVRDVAETLTDLRSNVDAIGKHGRRATDIVASMLQHARGATGDREMVDLNAFVGQYINLAKFGARGGDNTPVTVGLEFDEAVGQVQILPQEFGQVLVNLLNNAFDAVRDRLRRDPGSGEGVVTVRTHRSGTWVEVSVADNGVGVPDAIREKIFEPFFTTKAGKEGTGLGLSLCYEIVVQGHGGQLTVDSLPGKGSTFVVGVPVTREQAAGAQEARDTDSVH